MYTFDHMYYSVHIANNLFPTAAIDEEVCLAMGGQYCGTEENNWTEYAPDGCVPSYWVCDSWDDCADGSDETLGVCGGNNLLRIEI